ncbi:MAG: hypothetical protein U1C71_04925 [archaeon]|nr:hypothetical protein [archaeon]
MGNRGQAFEAYRVLIAGVITLAVLVIIFGALGYFESLREDASYETLYTSWKSAVDSPNGKVIIASKLAFTQGTIFSRPQFARQVNLENACIALEAESAAGYLLNDTNPDAPFIQVSGNILGNVYMQCRPDNFIFTDPQVGCYVYCLLSFGKPLANTP